MRSKRAQDWIGRARAAALLVAAAALPVSGQAGGGQAGGAAPGFRIEVSSSAPAGSQLVREVDDPATGQRWLLLRNERDPGGPGRMVLAGVEVGVDGADGRLARTRSRGDETLALPVIRSGERLVVEEHTAILDAVLEARALKAAARGSTFPVRLTIGGRVVRVVALGPGRAELTAEAGVEP